MQQPDGRGGWTDGGGAGVGSDELVQGGRARRARGAGERPPLVAERSELRDDLIDGAHLRAGSSWKHGHVATVGRRAMVAEHDD